MEEWAMGRVGEKARDRHNDERNKTEQAIEFI